MLANMLASLLALDVSLQNIFSVGIESDAYIQVSYDTTVQKISTAT